MGIELSFLRVSLTQPPKARLELELQRLRPGEPHSEEREAILGHVEGAVVLTVLRVGEGGIRKIALTLFAYLGEQPVNIAEDISVPLPEELRNVPRVGERLAILEGDDRDERD